MCHLNASQSSRLLKDDSLIGICQQSELGVNIIIINAHWFKLVYYV
jgi:hypothetical protein